MIEEEKTKEEELDGDEWDYDRYKDEKEIDKYVKDNTFKINLS